MHSMERGLWNRIAIPLTSRRWERLTEKDFETEPFVFAKHDLRLDIVPPGYRLTSRRGENGQLQREVKYDPTAFFLSTWLRCLVFKRCPT